MKLTLDEYSKQFKISKEMIHSKLRAKKLNYIVENSQTYIITKEEELLSAVIEKKAQMPARSTPRKQKTTVATILALYQKENKQLKEKIIQLEKKIDKLIDDKEQMLRDERDKIEMLYSSKDEQLRNILELINAKMAMEHKTETIHEIESFSSKKDEEKKELQKSDVEIIELRSYLKTLGLKSYQRKIIKKRFLAVYDSDIRIIQQNGKLYLDLSKYDYSDLLAY